MPTGWHCPQCGDVDADSFTLYRADRPFNARSKRFGPWCLDCGSRVVFAEDDEREVAIPHSPFARVLLLSGSCASGKSTVSYLMSERYGLAQIDGDWILDLRRRELRRKVTSDEIQADMLAMAAGMVALDRSAIIAHVILPEAFAACVEYLSARGIAHQVVILRPNMATLLERNRTRDCWPKPTPEYWVRKFHDELSVAPEDVRLRYYDNSGESEERTAERMWELLCSTPERV